MVDLVGAAGFSAVVLGAWIQFGPGWALIVAGLPLCVAYVVLELRSAQRGR
jgi:hypothetical protein